MEEFFLGTFLAAQELYVVDQQHVGRAVVPVKELHALVLDAGDHLVHEPLARRVNDPHAGMLVNQRTSDSMHQMRLAHAHSAVDEQRIVGARGIRRYRLRRCMRELIAGAHHEAVERELRVQTDGRRENNLGFVIARMMASVVLRVFSVHRWSGILNLIHYLPKRKTQVANSRPNVGSVFLQNPIFCDDVRNAHPQPRPFASDENCFRHPVLEGLRTDLARYQTLDLIPNIHSIVTIPAVFAQVFHNVWKTYSSSLRFLREPT